MSQPKKNTKAKQRRIEPVELVLILFFAVFGILWMRIAIPYLSKSLWYNSLNPVWQYAVYNIGIILLFSATFGIPVGYFIKKSINLPDIIRGGFSAFISFSWFIDLWAPPLAWDSSGKLAIQLSNENMESSSVDYMFGWIFQQWGIHGTALYDMVYILVPIIAILIAGLLLKPKEVLKILS